MPDRLSPRRPLAHLTTAIALAAALAGCGTSGGAPRSGGSAGSAITGVPSATGSSAATSPTGDAEATQSSAPGSLLTCAQQTLAGLDLPQRAGQLVMIGLDAQAPRSALDQAVSSHHVGNVLYLGGWEGAEKVTAASRHLRSLVTERSTGGVGLLIAADQEGGVVHQLRGAGFTQPPKALVQGTWSAERLTREATTWGKEVAAAGVNVNLAPVADVVPTALGAGNEPIGKWGRQYGSDPTAVARSVRAFVAGMQEAGVESAVKHFPGLGRVRNNTDFSATGITDATTTRTDAALEPFRAGIDAGAGLVMVSSATYAKIDPGTPALFSRTVIGEMLRGDLGWTGVVTTDDTNTVALQSVPVADRAVRFVDAGGDIVMSGDPASAPVMTKALVSKANQDPAFRTKLDHAALRVLDLKDRMGLLPCSLAP